MENILERFQKLITYALLIIAMVFISFQTVELVWETVRSFVIRFKEVGLNYNPEYGKNVLVLFFNVLLGLEILETIKVFNKSHAIKVRVILLICLIASSRKIFIMDIAQADVTEDLAIAALILALSLSYFFVTRQSVLSESPEQ